MNEKKISFIICTNDELYMSECRLYLEELNIPEEFEMDIIEIKGAVSMTSACNEGMKSTDAKYKVYLHQDVFIRNRNFIRDILDIFQADKQIGALGMVGTPYMIKKGIMWNGIRYGGFYKLKEYVEQDKIRLFYPILEGYLEVEAVDGLLIATQYDIPWREDMFKKWDFYDVSQCFEFLKAGYKVVVPGQATDWYIHDCGVLNLTNYEEERKNFLKEYGEFMDSRQDEGGEEYLNIVREHVMKGYHGPEEERQKLLAYLDTVDVK